jgi:type III secretion protein C
MESVKITSTADCDAAPRRPLASAAAAFLLAFAFSLSAPGPLAAAPIPWKLPSYTLVARGMDLRVALDTFAVAEGLSVVMSPSVSGVFSGDFKDTPPFAFLDKLATTHNLIWYYDGAALYVYGAGEISTMLIDLQYMKAGEVRRMLVELGVEDERFPLKTTSDDELIMVSGPPRYVALVAEMVAKADRLREKRTFSEVEARIFPLKYTWADDVSFKANSPESSLTIRGVARLLEEIMSGSLGGVREAAITNELSAFEARQLSTVRPIIRAENRLNAVVVKDAVSRMGMYERLIRELDVPQKLVEVDVTTLELSRKDALDWQLSLSLSTSRGHSDYGAGQNAANIFSPEALAGKGLAGALTHVHSAYALAASLTALREKGKARSISRTSLLTVNNLAAEMSDTQSYHARVVGTEVATLESVSAGTRLQVKPRILPSHATNVADQVWLSLELGDGGFESITVDAMPMTRSSTLQTQTAVFEGESIVLAGYLRDIEESAGWGIPYLRDIPWIGWLFGGSSTRKETVQRLFVLTPHVVDLDADMLARLQATRMRDVLEAETLQDDADASDEERERRALERRHTSERRRERHEDALRRRRAELDHAKAMRQVERGREERRLDEDVDRWKDEEAEAMRMAAELFEEMDCLEEGGCGEGE